MPDLPSPAHAQVQRSSTSRRSEVKPLGLYSFVSEIMGLVYPAFIYFLLFYFFLNGGDSPGGDESSLKLNTGISNGTVNATINDNGHTGTGFHLNDNFTTTNATVTNSTTNTNGTLISDPSSSQANSTESTPIIMLSVGYFLNLAFIGGSALHELTQFGRVTSPMFWLVLQTAVIPPFVVPSTMFVGQELEVDLGVGNRTSVNVNGTRVNGTEGVSKQGDLEDLLVWRASLPIRIYVAIALYLLLHALIHGCLTDNLKAQLPLEHMGHFGKVSMAGRDLGFAAEYCCNACLHCLGGELPEERERLQMGTTRTSTGVGVGVGQGRNGDGNGGDAVIDAEPARSGTLISQRNSDEEMGFLDTRAVDRSEELERDVPAPLYSPVLTKEVEDLV